MTITPFNPPNALTQLPRGNLLTYSNDGTDAAWTKSGAADSASGSTDPFGGSTAQTMTAAAGGALHADFQAVTVQEPALAYTFSRYVKAGSVGYVVLKLGDTSGAVFAYATLNLSTGAITGLTTSGAVANVAAEEFPEGSGWFRFSIGLQDPSVDTWECTTYVCNAAGTVSYSAAGTESILICGAQLEPGGTPGAYVATAAAADPGIWGGVAGLPVLPWLPGRSPKVTKAPMWSTEVIRTASGRERRTSYWPSPLWQFEHSYGVLQQAPSEEDLALLWEFFNVAQGQFGPFLFVDPTDCQVPASSPAAFGTGDGSTLSFQLLRQINSFSEAVYGVYGPTILDNGSAAGAYTIGPNGVVTFATAPAAGHALTWSGYFYFGCRFLQDDLSFDRVVNTLWTGKSLKFTSLRP